MKKYENPKIRIVECSSSMLCTSSPSTHEHGYKGDGSNGKGWGPGGKPKGVFGVQDIYESE